MNDITTETTLLTLLENKRYPALRDILRLLNPTDLAEILQNVCGEKLPVLFRLLPKELAAETFVEMDSDQQEMLVRSFSDTELRAIMDELYLDDAVDVLEEMPANVVKRILSQTDAQTRATINELLHYPQNSAGSIMTTEFVDLRPQMSVEEAVAHIRATGIDKETINTCYVMDRNRVLIGCVTIRTLILAQKDAQISDIMQPRVISATTLDDQEAVAQKLSRYDLLSLPVVDGENRLVGIVTVDDALDVLEEETTEDIEKMAAITPSTKPYLKTSPFTLWKNRIPWLLLMMVSATFTSAIISHFQAEAADVLAAAPALIAFIPMLMDTAGNAGSQTSVTVIRGMSLSEIEFPDFFRVLFKEVRVSLLCGGALAVCTFGKLLLLDRVTVLVAMTVSCTMLATVCFAKMIGAMLPMLAKRLHLDPAVMASPFITTIVDALALLVYFNIAGLLL